MARDKKKYRQIVRQLPLGDWTCNDLYYSDILLRYLFRIKNTYRLRSEIAYNIRLLRNKVRTTK